MNELLSILCFTAIGLILFVSFVGYKLLSLPLVTNIIYLKLGGAVASDLVADVADAVVAVKTPSTDDVVTNAIITVLNQYNLIPLTTTEPVLIEEAGTNE